MNKLIGNALKVMNSALSKYLIVLLSAGLPLPLSAEAPSAEAPSPLLSSVFQEHCVKCHGKGGKFEGEINLLALHSADELQAHPKLLERLLTVLQDREMPPEDEPPLPEAKRQQMVARLKTLLAQASKTQTFGPTPIRRMNRFQYNNAVVDLLELDRDIFQLNERLLRRRDDYFRPETGEMPAQVRVSSRPLSKDIDNQRPEGFRDVAPFPQDKRAEHGFDNRADHLTLSPLLMESFLQLSQTIVESPDLNPQECRSWDRLFALPSREASPSSEPAVDADLEAVRVRLARLLRRAFRHPVDPETLDRFTQFAGDQLASGASFEDTMRTVVGAVLGMPDFLYLYETVEAAPENRLTASRRRRRGAHSKDADASGSPFNEESRQFDGAQASDDGSQQGEFSATGRQHVNDFELASRLAQFFWSSIPDDTLLDLAEAGQLSDSETLSTQIDRMMNDRRSSRFCDNFPVQWLQLDRLITSIPDPQKFSYFYYNGYRTSMHMMSEPLLLFETVFIEDRSIMDLLAPDFSWQSDMLGANYEGNSNGARQVQVQTFKRVPLDDPRRGGVITNAAIMTMTSTPTRTQPITRGAWVNSVIFNDPPEPPPADVPPLPEVNAEELSKLTIRERLAVHRQRADCAGCHNKIDPLGFALENYGPTGVWRDKYENGRDVDVSGRLFNQHEFTTLVEFKHLVLQEKPRFIRGFVAHLLSYALGRELGPADSPALDDMTAKATSGNDRMRSVLKSVAMSEPFLHKNLGNGEQP